MSHRMSLDVHFSQNKTARITGTLTKEDGVTPVASADLTSLTLTLYDQATGGIINTRNAQSILNANGGTVHATSGLLTLVLSPADMPIVTTGRTRETHIALIQWTYNGGADKGAAELELEVYAILKVTA